MKYTFTNAPPKDHREDTNRHVMEYLHEIEPEVIFSSFTGLGGLHGLKRHDFENFHEYTEAKKEIELGQFFTPPPLCEAIVSAIQPEQWWKVCDFTCGSGNFFNYMPTEENCYGIEIEDAAFKVARMLYPNARILQGDFVEQGFAARFDFVVGNPPFNLKTKQGVSQYVFVRKAGQYLKPGGFLAFIAPKSFLEDEYANKNKWNEIAVDFDFLCQSELKNQFDVDIEIKLLFFQKRGVNPTGKVYCNDYIDFNPETIFREYIEPLKIANLKERAKLRLLEKATLPDMPDYPALIKKWLYHIKKQKELHVRYYSKALEMIEDMKKERPPDMDWKKWDEIRVTPEKVAAWLHSKVKKQYRPKPKKLLKMVRVRAGFKVKAYHRELASQQKTIRDCEWLPNNGIYHPGFVKLQRKKRRDYDRHNQAYGAMERNEKLDAFLREFELIDVSNGTMSLFEEPEVIKLNEKQFIDLGLAFQKDYSILAWQQGSGKSVAGMAWIEYVKSKCKHVFITAPSLAVQLTWDVRLKKYGYNYKLISHWSDFKAIKRGQILLISFDMVRILNRHLKHFIKRTGYNIALMVDESDELTNMQSSRTRSMLTCFRKAKYKILTTGTTTRNNINELYPQLELLYNNSVNFISWAETIFREDKDKELDEQNNPHYGEPYPAFRGHNLFKYSFCPQKTTVFGIRKDTQDVFNCDVLKDIINRTIITRTFDDIVGKKIYKIKTHQVVQGVEERKLYAVIIEDFYKIVGTYYKNTGSDRKEQMLRLIRQIKLLINATSTPHKFPHYESKELPMKFYHIHGMLEGWPKEKVAIGTVTLIAAQEYYGWLQKQFPGRPFFYVDGGKSFGQRKRLIAQFQATTNGVLISTQQSLKSSVDIETCDRAILESMQWNIPKMSQYYFRFIRYNSKKEKEIHFITYADTIEQNILALLMAKEKLNQFIKTTELQERDDIYEEFDVDTGILDQIIEKEYDKEGNMHLRWGKQKLLN